MYDQVWIKGQDVKWSPNKNVEPWPEWLSGLSTALWTKGSPVPFPVRAHAWVVGQACSRGRSSGWEKHQPHIDVSLLFLPPFPSLKVNKIFLKTVEHKRCISFFFQEVTDSPDSRGNRQTRIHLTDTLPFTRFPLFRLYFPFFTYTLSSNLFWFLITDEVDRIQFALNLKYLRNFNNQGDHIQ